jgi:hypothetical protein
LDEFVRIQSSKQQRLALVHAALHLQENCSHSLKRARLRQRGARYILNESRDIVADLFPVLSSINSYSEDLSRVAQLSLAHRERGADESARGDDSADHLDALRKRVLQLMAELKPLLAISWSLLDRIEQLARWNTAHHWELSIDAQRWDLLHSTHTCAVAHLTTLLGDEIKLDEGGPTATDSELEIDNIERSSVYREFFSRFSSEDSDSDECTTPSCSS